MLERIVKLFQVLISSKALQYTTAICALSRETRSSGSPFRPDTNRPVQSQEKARSLKFWGDVEEELYYTCGENKGADQLCSYCTADLRLCFRIGKNLAFS